MVTILDGSTGHELKERLGVLNTAEDSFAAAMMANVKHPELVTAVHADYVASGCDVLTTNTFTLTPSALEDAGRAGELPTLLHAACTCAADAAAGADGRNVLIAGCLPPLSHCYLQELVQPRAQMLPAYTTLVRELAPRVDFFLAETLCASEEVHAALQAAKPTGKPCWLSLTLHDDASASAASAPTLRGGERVTDVIASLTTAKLLPSALLYNCCAPQVVAAALRAVPGPPAGIERLGGYANGFRSTTSEWLASEGARQMGCDGTRHTFSSCPTCAGDYDALGVISPEAYASHACDWCDLGARIVGGCCGVSAKHMRVVAETLRQSAGPGARARGVD